MGLKIFNINASDVAIDNDLRTDCKFFSFWNKSKWFAFDNILKRDKSISLKEIIYPFYITTELEDDREYKGIPTGKEYIDEDGFIVSFQKITKDEKPDRLKYFADIDQILISSLRGAKSPALNFDEDISGFVFSNGFYFFKVYNGWNKKFILHFLRSEWLKKTVDNSIYRGIGISSYKERDLLKIRLPYISKEIQDNCVELIKPIENEIKILKSQIKPDTEIINEIFTKRFYWDITKFNELKNIHLMNSNFSSFSNNIDNRFSFKFHNIADAFVLKTLKSQTSKHIKDFLAEEITLGKSISPSDFDENGEQYYVSMADIKNWRFETEEAKTICRSYFDANPNKRISLNDIIMARSGEGTIGKVALIYNEEIEGIYADFTMRIRLKDYSPAFTYYYFRTDFFQYLVYTHKKGLGNNTNIFPSQVQEFPIPEISLADQEKIVKQIKSETNKQREFENKILAKKEQINKLIHDAILQ